jgi:PAS domain S-box-containing protein
MTKSETEAGTNRATAGDAPSSAWRDAPVPMALVDTTGTIVAVNRGFERLVREPAEDLRGRALGELWDIGDTFASPSDVVKRLHELGALAVFATRNPRRNDLHVPPVALRLVVLDEHGEDQPLVAVQVVEHAMVEHARKVARTRLRRSLDQLGMGFFQLSLDGQILEANEAICRLLGCERDELLAAEAFSFTHIDDRPADVRSGVRALSGELIGWTGERRLVRRDGTIVWVLESVTLIRSATDEPLHFACQVSDLSAYKAREAAAVERLSAAERADLPWLAARAGAGDRLHPPRGSPSGPAAPTSAPPSTVDAWSDAALKSSVAMARVDLAGRILQVNASFESLALKPEWRLTEHHLGDLWEVASTFADADRLRARLIDDGALSVDAHPTAAFAHLPGCSLRIVPIGAADAAAAELLVRVNEVDIVQAARRTSPSGDELEDYLDDLEVGIFTLALEGEILEVNAAMARLLGYTVDEFRHREAFSFTHPEHRHIDVGNGIRALAGELQSWTCERRLIRRDGSLVWVLGSIALVRGDKGEPLHFVCHATDLSAQKEREAAVEALASPAADLSP